MVRTKKFKKSKARIFIFVEGETEQKYFEQVKQRLRLSGTGIDILKLDNSGGDWVDKANIHMKNNKKFKREDNNPVYVVFDKDAITQESFERMVAKANKQGIEIVFSNINFEVWLLAHFEKLTKGSLSKQQLKDKLGHYIGINYQKADSRQLEKMVKNLELAIENARAVEKVNFYEQSTNIGRMIEKIKAKN